VVDSDQFNPDAVRQVNGWGINLTRQANDAWRLRTNLVVDGDVNARTLCRIEQLVQEGEPVPGAITLTCGEQDPVRLTTFQCGNGRIDPAETCDDGNFASGDGCDPRCLAECGNGRQDPNEACDDGNLAPNDACTDQCEVARCGDNIIQLGVEACDNGDANSEEPAADCRTDCTARRCGDGVQDPGEACDDGNDVNGDGCETNCTVCDGLSAFGECRPTIGCDDFIVQSEYNYRCFDLRGQRSCFGYEPLACEAAGNGIRLTAVANGPIRFNSNVNDCFNLSPNQLDNLASALGYRNHAVEEVRNDNGCNGTLIDNNGDFADSGDPSQDDIYRIRFFN